MNVHATLRALDLEPIAFLREFRKGLYAENALAVALHLGGAFGFHMFPATKYKTPLCDWDAEATCDPRGIIRLYRRVKNFYGEPECWCVRTGREFGLWVIDVDGKLGRERLRELPPLPDTVTVTTGRPDGGTHYWYSPTAEGPDLKSVGHALIGGKRAPIDQKGRGGYAVVPGSIHASGARYRFVEGRALGDL